MIKKILLIYIACCLLSACGKKADPEYKANKNNILIQRV